MSLGAQDENTMRIAKKNLDVTVAKISAYNSSLVVIDDASDDDNDDDNDETSLPEMPTLDPLRKKGKGTTYGRLKSSSEKKKKKYKKGTPQNLIESRELAVQATEDVTNLPDYSRYSNQTRNTLRPNNIGGPIVNLNLHNQMQPPYIMPTGIMNGFSSFTSQMQRPYIMPPGVVNGFSPFTSQMLEYHNRSHGNILSQGPSNFFPHPRMHELNDYEGIDNARSHDNSSEGGR
ncbi:uncharacterized protein LOC115667611 isoform X2 [Syzygium oleosum]|nr:uncharacterized protein LOC115667611 isoform X2 [Syzygium oleosum]XP_056166909.1 uncharacterized protein LOC115667611 isoform X2 [Syzygium oleosum]